MVSKTKTIGICPLHEPIGNKNCLRRLSYKRKVYSDETRINNGWLGSSGKGVTYIRHKLTKIDGLWICEKTGNIYYATSISDGVESDMDLLGTVQFEKLPNYQKKGRVRVDDGSIRSSYESYYHRIYYRPSSANNNLRALTSLWLYHQVGVSKGKLYIAKKFDTWNKIESDLREIGKVKIQEKS